MKKTLRILSVLLALVMFAQPMLPAHAASEQTQLRRMLRNMTPVSAGEGTLQSVSAEQTSAAEPDELSIDTASPEISPIIGEIAEFGDESTRHFRHENGTFTAAMYPEPVRFKDVNGAWQDIDNTLTLDENKRSTADESTYTPAASGLDISIPQDFGNGQQAK